MLRLLHKQHTSKVSVHAQHKVFLLTKVTKCEAVEKKFQVSANYDRQAIKKHEVYRKNVTISLRIISQPNEHDNGDFIRAMHTANKAVVLLMCSKHLHLLSKAKEGLNHTYFSKLLF